MVGFTSDEKEIVSDEVKIGKPFLTRYERARIVGARALQLSMGAPMLLLMEEEIIDPILIARKELAARVLPLSVMRHLPNGYYQNIPIQQLQDAEYVDQIKVERKKKE